MSINYSQYCKIKLKLNITGNSFICSDNWDYISAIQLSSYNLWVCVHLIKQFFHNKLMILEKLIKVFTFRINLQRNQGLCLSMTIFRDDRICSSEIQFHIGNFQPIARSITNGTKLRAIFVIIRLHHKKTLSFMYIRWHYNKDSTNVK